MKLCDECIQKLRESLNSETKEILNNRVFPLLEKRENVSGKELAKAMRLDRPGVKQVIEELKTHLLLDYFYRGRKRIYRLTETAKRYRKLQRNPDLMSDSKPASQAIEVETVNSNQEQDQEQEQEEVEDKKEVKETNQRTEEKEAEQEKEVADKTNKAEVKEQSTDSNQAEKSKEKSEAEEKSRTNDKDNQKSSQQEENKDLVWNMKL